MCGHCVPATIKIMREFRCLSAELQLCVRRERQSLAASLWVDARSRRRERQSKRERERERENDTDARARGNKSRCSMARAMVCSLFLKTARMILWRPCIVVKGWYINEIFVYLKHFV